MTSPDTKILTVKMRGIHGSAKTEMLLAIARFARQFGMVPALNGDGHNMVITSTKAQRLALYHFNHSHHIEFDGEGEPLTEWPAPARRQLLPDGDVG